MLHRKRNVPRLTLIPASLKPVEPIIQVLDDVLPLGRQEFLLCHVGAIFDLQLEAIQLGILRVSAVTEEEVLGAD